MTEVLGHHRFQGCFEHVAGEQPHAPAPLIDDPPAAGPIIASLIFLGRARHSRLLPDQTELTDPPQTGSTPVRTRGD